MAAMGRRAEGGNSSKETFLEGQEVTSSRMVNLGQAREDWGL